MKNFTFLHRIVLLLLSATFLFSCKKENNDSGINEIPAVSSAAAINCKATNFAVLVEFPDQFQRWHNLMQRWYGPDGKVSHIKAMMSPHFNEFADFTDRLEYGEVTYHNNNQVYVRDVLYNRLKMRVTVDANGRPLASYYYNIPVENQLGEIDTTYYHYSGDKLDHIYNIQAILRGPNNQVTPRLTRYNFIYDVYGNLTRVESGNSPGSFKMFITYDYSKPVTDMMTAHYFNHPLRLLDYLDLLHMPVHHQPIQVWLGSYTPGSIYPFETFPTEIWNYANYSLLENGLVRKYNDTEGYTKKTYYTGWDCDDAIISSATEEKAKPIVTFEAFKKRFPASFKDKK